MAKNYYDLAHAKTNRYHQALHTMPGLSDLRKLARTARLGINGYTPEGCKAKASMHRNGKTLLDFLGSHAHPSTTSVRVSSNPGGVAVSGEVTLHTDWVWCQLSKLGSRLVLMYRRPQDAANSVRWDVAGTNQFVYLDERNDPVLDRTLRQMLERFSRWEQASLREREQADAAR